MQRPWMLIHVPKCGGTSIVNFMRQNHVKMYPAEKNGNPVENGKPLKLWKRDTKGINHFFQHCKNNRVEFFAMESRTLSYEWRKRCRTILALRDPWTQFVSHYAEYIQNPVHKESPEEYMENRRNFYIRHLSGFATIKENSIETTHTSKSVTEEDIVRARDVLYTVDVLIILEDPKSFRRLTNQFGKGASLPHSAARPKKNSLEHLKERFLELNKADIALYEEAVRLHQARASEGR